MAVSIFSWTYSFIMWNEQRYMMLLNAMYTVLTRDRNKIQMKLLYPYFSELYLEHVNLNLLINITNKISYALFEFW